MLRPAAPRLACVKPVASVHPEPGSNSPLLLFCLLFSVFPCGTASSARHVAVPRPEYSAGAKKCLTGFAVAPLPLTERSARRLFLILLSYYLLSVLSRSISKIFALRCPASRRPQKNRPALGRKAVQSYCFPLYPANFSATFFEKISRQSASRCKLTYCRPGRGGAAVPVSENHKNTGDEACKNMI